MRLKLTYERGHGGPPVDLLVTAGAATTVGFLADYLARSDPESQRPGGDGYTLSLLGGGHRELDPAIDLIESGIQSGATIGLASTEGRYGTGVQTDVVGAVVVVSGPDKGREFPIGHGTSTLGRERDCVVRLTDPMVSRHHANIHVGESIEIIDMGSSNGLIVGENVTDRVILHPGDEVKVGDSLISVRVLHAGSESAQSAVHFNRPPRIDPRYVGVEFPTPEPPDPLHEPRFPILPLFAPMIFGLVLYLSTKSLTSLVFVAMSPLLIVANAAESRLSGRKSYREAVQLFREDIADLISSAEEARLLEADRRRREHPSTTECADAALTLSSVLWCRYDDLPGFAEVRLGLGRQASRNKFQVSGGKRNNRALWRELDNAIAPFAFVDDVPVVGRLSESAFGFAGQRNPCLNVARGLVLQIAALHSPAELVFAVLASSHTAASWEWTKWLPHCLSPQSPLEVSPLAGTDDGCSVLLGALEALIDERRGHQRDATGSPPNPSLLVVVEDDAPVERGRLVALAETGPSVGVYVVWVAADRSRLPAFCRTFVEVEDQRAEGNIGFVYTADLVTPVAMEPITDAEAEKAARKLAPVVDAAARGDEQSDLPRTTSLLSLVGRELAEDPDSVIERWVESRSVLKGVPASAELPPATLRALVGVSVLGPHILDVRTQGPHALVGGTTGAGKSELLQSWILGMALSNSPQRVTFLLVDYKGGSAFSECVHLPHTVGLVTDLSPHLVRRALTSLSAELQHRERILHRKGTKDLATLERRGDPEAPPSLVIVVDEFAALVQEVPEFVDGVVNVAQRGRSLGLHLILATQRPAGVIKDNLRANTNLRLALRMADEADSTDVLGSPEAATFDSSVPGRAISRTGPLQRTLFQAAYVGGWTSSSPEPPAIEVETLDLRHRRPWSDPTEKNGATTSDFSGPNDIERVVSNIRSAHKKAEIPDPRLPWLPELAAVYDLARLPSPRRDDELVFGVLDEPEFQRQPTVAFHPDQDGNLAVYGTGNSGKSTLLRTLAVAAGLTVRGGPCHVYGLDFGARGLQMLDVLPNVGSVIPGSDNERIGRLLTMLRTVIDDRAERFARVGAGTITEYRRIAGENSEPRVLLLVDGMAAFRTAYEGTEHNRAFETFLGVAADGRPVGVHVVVSADRSGAVPAALASHLQRRLILRMADSNDYALMGAPVDALEAKSPAGRGLMGNQEVQVAVLGGTPDVVSQAMAVRSFARSMVNADASVAPPVERLPDSVALTELPEAVDDWPTIGVSGVTLLPIAFIARGTFLVAGPPASGRTTALATAVCSLKRWRHDARLFYVGTGRSFLRHRPEFERTACSVDEVIELAEEITQSLAVLTVDVDAPTVVVIESITEFVNGPADLALNVMVAALQSAGHLVIADGDTTALGMSFPLVAALKSERNGVILQPDQMDGALFRSQFPRLRRADFPAGRGLLINRGAQPVVVQIGLPEAP